LGTVVAESAATTLKALRHPTGDLIPQPSGVAA